MVDFGESEYRSSMKLGSDALRDRILALLAQRDGKFTAQTKRHTAARTAIAKGIARAAVNLGLTVLGGVDSAVHGPKGNVEHLLWMRSASA